MGRCPCLYILTVRHTGWEPRTHIHKDLLISVLIAGTLNWVALGDCSRWVLLRVHSLPTCTHPLWVTCDLGYFWLGVWFSFGVDWFVFGVRLFAGLQIFLFRFVFNYTHWVTLESVLFLFLLLSLFLWYSLPFSLSLSLSQFPFLSLSSCPQRGAPKLRRWNNE